MGGGTIHVLYVDSGPPSAGDISRRLESARESLRVTTVDSGSVDALSTELADCVVCDCALSDPSAAELLEAVREEDTEVPLVLFTDDVGGRTADESIPSFVDAYVPKQGEGRDHERLLGRIEDLVSRHRSETNYREVFEKAAVAMSVRDPETGRFLDVNERYCELTGYSRGELIGRTSEEVGGEHAGYTADRAHELLRQTIEEGSQTVEWVNERRDGTSVRVQATLKPAEIDGQTRVLVSLHDVTDQREREADLERKNDLFERTQRIGHIGGWELDVETDELRWTDEVRRILGVPPDFDPDPDGVVEWFHPDDQPTVREAFSRSVIEGEPYDIEARVTTDDGDTRWVRIRADPQTTGDGQRRIRGTVRDITDRKRREELLHELHHRTRELIRAETPTEIAHIAVETAEETLGLPLSGIHLDDGDGTLRAAAVTDAVREHVGENPDYDRSSTDHGDELAWEVFESGESRLIEDIDTNGDLDIDSAIRSGLVYPLGDHGVFITSSPDPEQFGEEEQAFAEMLAATTTAALDRAKREQRYDAIFNQTFQFTGLTQPDGTLTEANDTALTFVDATREEVTGKPLWETPWFQYDDDTRQLARDAVERARAGGFFRGELPIVGGDGEEIITDFSLRPVTDETGQVIMLVPEGRDITELKEREAELERKNEQLEEFASVVSHDLRNPLAVASGHLELALEEYDDDNLEYVKEAHDRMESLIDDLLALARQGTSVDERRVVDLEATVRRSWRTVETGDATLRVASNGSFEADPSRLGQLFENLFRNAVEYAGNAPTVTVGVLDDGDGFYVEDDGPGIPPERRDRVFEAGHTTSETGTGFGLRIVERIATAHGWTIVVTEGADGGARFEVTGVEMRVDGKTV
ncbi:PAS domain S-box protein [Natronomonas sp. CBA1123]|uniref:PAS domain S-box protein n=1 Tax=Natronomonas sp. CBA1123 TaxID=2668070 RepID=UPI0018D27128|nr:PAS domain S-box protein [Natronomonas sp. CBA1123]